MTTSIKQRRKYRFPDRAAAEDALRDAESESHRRYRFAAALYADAVQWIGRKRDYRIGVFYLDSGGTVGRIVQVFQPRGQNPSITVWDYEDFQEHVAGFRNARLGCMTPEDFDIDQLYGAACKTIRG